MELPILHRFKTWLLDGRTDLPGYQLFKESATLEGSQSNFHHINPDELDPELPSVSVYKLLIGGITPRPIAFCSTISEEGILGLAPFSYFAPMGQKPPMVS